MTDTKLESSTVFSYDDTDIYLTYDHARALPRASLRQWLDRISYYLRRKRIRNIIDVGCGTGRFSEALSKYFHATVYAVDPSEKMLSVARKKHPRNIKFMQGAAERLPVPDASMDVVFLSMVLHHIVDKKKACSEFHRVLVSDGILVIRTSTLETLQSHIWLSFFPEAEEIERQRIPSQSEVIETLTSNHFTLREHEVLKQHGYARNLDEYCQKIAARGQSSLREISNDAFQSGIRRMYQARRHMPDRPVDTWTDLFIFEKTSDRAIPGPFADSREN
ncbi:MAG: class I SAM-dependent methyltransferase [Acidobacteriaceae bacterium]|nr:class I SAM-dependent methyltransferase [Acidobacteriaceae bacterium]